MKLCFDSIAEVREFIASLKGTRGKKGDDDDDNAGTANQAPAPLMPPRGQPGTFQPQQAATFSPPQGGGFPGAPTSDPVVTGLVQRINAKIESSVASGQPVDAVLTWFRGRCGAEAANATMDQIKQLFLPRLAVPVLEDIAKLMNA